MERLLTQADHDFFRENGYVLVHDVVPKQNLDAVIDAVWSFLGMDRSDPSGWYHEPHSPGGMVEIYQHQALWDNRQHPRMHQLFTEIMGTDRLWVSLDRTCMKPPRHPDHPEWEHKGFIHWDADTSKPQTFGVQGVLYLADTAADQGGFQCVPELFRDYPEWVKSQPADRNPHVPDMAGYEATPIPGKAGDMVVWNKLLAHGNGHNVSSKPRLAQFINMRLAPIGPLNDEDEERRQHRIRCWQERIGPGGKPFPGDPRGWEAAHYGPAELTPLGRKLLGLDLWPA